MQLNELKFKLNNTGIKVKQCAHGGNIFLALRDWYSGNQILDVTDFEDKNIFSSCIGNYNCEIKNNKIIALQNITEGDKLNIKIS